MLLFHQGGFLDEESFARKFGSSEEIRKSVANALQRKANSQNILTNSVDEAKEVGHCQYESQTSWGKTVILLALIIIAYKIKQ